MISEKLLGYVIFTFAIKDRERVFTVLLQEKIRNRPLSESEETFTVAVPLYAVRKCRRCLFDRVRSESDPRGLPGRIFSLRRRPGLIAGIFLSLMLYMIFNSLIWDVRITSSEDIDQDSIFASLEEMGIGIGTKKKAINEDKIASELMLREENLSFVTVGMEGTVLNIDVIPWQNEEMPPINFSAQNIVASEDAVIRDINVTRGKAEVKVGQVVHAGDLLISGIISDVGGTRLLRAEGGITGEVERTVSVRVPLTETVTYVSSQKPCGAHISFFGWQGKWGEYGDITRRIHPWLFSVAALPFQIDLFYQTESSEKQITRSVEEALQIAKDRSKLYIEGVMEEGAVTFIEYHTDISDEAVVMTWKMKCEVNLGKGVAISVENK